jgi:hypothetical protein
MVPNQTIIKRSFSSEFFCDFKYFLLSLKKLRLLNKGCLFQGRTVPEHSAHNSQGLVFETHRWNQEPYSGNFFYS